MLKSIFYTQFTAKDPASMGNALGLVCVHAILGMEDNSVTKVSGAL